MTYEKPFFDLQIRFARKVAALSDVPIGQVLLDCTNLYVRFGLGRTFDPEDPVWQRYLAGIDESPASLETWTFDFYRSRLPERAPPMVVASVGCFSYARSDSNRIRIHFHNAETGRHSPLAADRIDFRLAELRELFGLVRQQETSVVSVVGASWLYNLPAYCRLFPDRYIASAEPVPPTFRNMPLWGQFLDRRGGVRDGIAAEFVYRLEATSHLSELPHCFAFAVLRLETSVSVFHKHYGVRPG